MMSHVNCFLFVMFSFDRSMSLPLNSPMSGVESSYDSGMSEGRDVMRNSPVRRMDFALCELYLRFRCLLQYHKIKPALSAYPLFFHTLHC
jgi:hypothetical protein